MEVQCAILLCGSHGVTFSLRPSGLLQGHLESFTQLLMGLQPQLRLQLKALIYSSKEDTKDCLKCLSNSFVINYVVKHSICFNFILSNYILPARLVS
ncbi:hypothetical protein C0J52_16004 [Blattella germanica]|nr:hypothetical protein C0J52_16004 [Blattella germanica]